MRSLLRFFGSGLLMGTADIIPGVSGGTMALIVGVYETLVDSISALFSAALALVRVDLVTFRTQWEAVAWRVVLPLGGGILTAILVAAEFIPALLERYPVQSRGLFFGLITASLIIPWDRMTIRTITHLGTAILAAVAAFVLSGLPPQTVADPSLLVVFGAAMIAICAMILPGVSGSFLLLVMGMYAPTLEAIDARDLAYVATFAVGAGLGIGLFSKLLTWLLGRYHDLTMAALVGLMAGSLRALWPWQTETRALQLPTSGDPLGSVLLLGLVGFAVVTALVIVGRRLDPAASPALEPTDG